MLSRSGGRLRRVYMQKNFALVPFLVLVVSSAAFAQSASPVPHKQTIATAPISDILGFFNVEYQRKISDFVAVGASAGVFEEDFDPGGDDETSNVMGFARYYPQGTALNGFFLGVRAGVFRDTTFTFDPATFQSRREKRARGAFGIDVGYDWLLGKKQNVLIGVGAGGVRLLGGSDSGFDAYPTARLNVGFAF